MINNGEVAGPTSAMSGRRVDFGKAREGDGLAWGIEVDIDLSDSLAKARFQEMKFEIPTHIKHIKFLELTPQEALPPPAYGWIWRTTRFLAWRVCPNQSC